MFNGKFQSSFVLTLAIAVSAGGYMLIGFDSVGEPSFDVWVYPVLTSSLLLPFAATIWYTLEGNTPEEIPTYITWAYLTAAIAMFVWMWSTLPTLDALPAIALFGLLMLLATMVHMLLLTFVVAFAFCIAMLYRRLSRTGRISGR